MNPHATNHPISWVKRFHDAGELDLSPSFQRKPVWSDTQAAFLIDTILNDLPVPELFVRTITDTEGNSRVEVVDGQQRLRAIIRFYKNELVLSGHQITPKWLDSRWETLGQAEREHFWQFKLVIRELEGASDAEVRDMFRRLNVNQSNLNDQELRHSQYSGQFITLVESLADDPWWLNHGIVTPAQVRRMVDAEFISELLVSLISGPLDKKSGLDEFYADYDDDFPDRDHWLDIFLQTRSLTQKVAGPDLRGWRTKTEFYSLFLACARFVLDQVEFNPSDIRAIQGRLARFRALADQAKRRGNTEVLPDFVEVYAEAVTRASTDLGRRLDRIDTVFRVISGELELAE